MEKIMKRTLLNITFASIITLVAYIALYAIWGALLSGLENPTLRLFLIALMTTVAFGFFLLYTSKIRKGIGEDEVVSDYKDSHTIFDMQVLTHELGHAFAGYMAMRSQPISDYYSESTDIAEIHSMSMEQFAYPYAEWFFGDQADKFRFAHLQEALTFVPFGVAVDEFQHICYAHPEMTPKERTYQWHLLEEKYMPWRRYEDDAFMERGGYWYHKLHIYLYPFYYINYTLTTMGAMEFKKKYAENRDAAWQDYLKLCKTGGSRSYLETLRYANLANPFEPGSVERAYGYAEEILLRQIAEQAK